MFQSQPERWIPMILHDDPQDAQMVVLQTFAGLSIRKQRSLLIENHIPVEGNCFVRIPQSLYDNWVVPGEKQLQEFKERWEAYLFRSSVPLFWSRREEILADRTLFFTAVPFHVFGLGNHRKEQPLGALLKAWIDYPDVYTHVCPHCGGTMIIHAFVGNPMTGTTSCSSCCTDCRTELLNQRGLRSFHQLREPLRELLQDPALESVVLTPMEDSIERLTRP